MLVAIAKPRGPTSHDIVDVVRRITGERCVGHAGTLDPMAEGVLVVGIGRAATKQLASVVGTEKEYIATIRFGATSTTDDAEGTITERSDAVPPTLDDVTRVLPRFIGRIEQTPPVFSAIKIAGKPAHRRVRRGEDVRLAPRTVTIHSIDIRSYAWPDLTLHITCGAGTYIRALARDLGNALGVGGHLIALTRTRVGPYVLEEALTLDALHEHWEHRRSSAA